MVDTGSEELGGMSGIGKLSPSPVGRYSSCKPSVRPGCSFTLSERLPALY